MNAGNWIAAMGVMIALLGIITTVQFRSNDIVRKERDDEKARADRLETENKVLRDANVDLKITNAAHNRTAEALERTLAALPIQRSGGTP